MMPLRNKIKNLRINSRLGSNCLRPVSIRCLIMLLSVIGWSATNSGNESVTIKLDLVSIFPIKRARTLGSMAYRFVKSSRRYNRWINRNSSYRSKRNNQKSQTRNTNRTLNNGATQSHLKPTSYRVNKPTTNKS